MKDNEIVAATIFGLNLTITGFSGWLAKINAGYWFPGLAIGGAVIVIIMLILNHTYFKNRS